MVSGVNMNSGIPVPKTLDLSTGDVSTNWKSTTWRNCTIAT